jgi:hypothetical protein
MGFENGGGVAQVADTTELLRKDATTDTSEPLSADVRGQSVAIEQQVDPVEQALADALGRAARSGEWGTVETLSRELTARREARSGVIDIAVERKRRGGS